MARIAQHSSSMSTTTERHERPRYNRYLHEVVELIRDCELGESGERAVVVELMSANGAASSTAGPRYMTLLFVNRPVEQRVVHTGADYRLLRTVK